jgi:PKD repeat protein
MPIPQNTHYPDAIDTNDNLFLVHDALRVRLAEDYNPGDLSINVTGDTSLFPPTGLITLTDQCDEPALRALSFYYGSRTTTTFDSLILLPDFVDVVKPKRLTNVTQNVMSRHHNHIKDALVAIEEFIGVRGTIDLEPLGPTMEGRINFLRKLVLRPRAWFKANRRIGVVPLKVTFTDLSFRNPSFFIWDFGDNTTSTTSVISVTSTVPSTAMNVSVVDLDGGTVEKVYFNPGLYTVTLTIGNEFGTDSVQFVDMINARISAPEPAVISFTPKQFQKHVPITLTPETEFIFDHLTPGTIRARTNTFISLEVIDNGEQSADPVIHYTWKINDDLDHLDAPTTNASFGIGGLYDIRLKVETRLGAYRNTVLPSVIDIIERQNLFLYIFDPLFATTAITKDVLGYEFGLISETFKVKNRTPYPVTKDHNFLSPALPNYEQQKREFLRNNAFAPRGTLPSGDIGSSLLYWAEGGPTASPLSTHKISFIQYEAFNDTWNSLAAFQISRPWNWASWATPSRIYFLLGATTTTPAPNTSPTNQTLTTVNLSNLAPSSIPFSSYVNGADELASNADPTGSGGHFSVYRTAWKDSNGYLLRNDGVGAFFRIKSFYRVEGITSNPFQTINKMPDLPGSPRLEGQIVPLSDGVYFFNNTGEVSVWNTTSESWSLASSGPNSPSFRSLQDVNVEGFGDEANTLLAASDSDRLAYLSYDYSSNAFIKFNQADLTFSLLPPRPTGEQFISGVY